MFSPKNVFTRQHVFYQSRSLALIALALFFYIIRFLQLYTCSLQLSIALFYQVGTPVHLLYNCLIFSMIMLIQLYKCTVQLCNGRYDHIDTTVQLHCTHSTAIGEVTPALAAAMHHG